jgi:hypothetical protein
MGRVTLFTNIEGLSLMQMGLSFIAWSKPKLGSTIQISVPASAVRLVDDERAKSTFVYDFEVLNKDNW